MRGKISTIVMERETRLELATICLEGRSSSQLSYSRKIHKKFYIFTSKLYSFNLKSTLIFTQKENIEDCKTENCLKKIKYLKSNGIIYLEKGNLKVVTLGRGYAWLDTGTVDSMNEASEFVRVVQKRAGIQVAALEEIAYNNGWIDKEQLLNSAETYGKAPYGQHLKKVAEGKIRY